MVTADANPTATTMMTESASRKSAMDSVMSIVALISRYVATLIDKCNCSITYISPDNPRSAADGRNIAIRLHRAHAERRLSPRQPLRLECGPKSEKGTYDFVYPFYCVRCT
jgi:hypothetical protein